MLDHLVHFEPEVTARGSFKKLGDATPSDTLSAQVATEQWLAEMGVDDDEVVANQQQTQAARKAFNAVTTNATTTEQKTSLAELKSPAAVRHLTGMLAAYDWQFIDMAQEIRGYTVAKLVEETKSPNANIRLKALIALGKVTEVGLFTEQIEVKKVEMTDAQVEQRIKDKLAKFMGVIDVVDVSERPDDSPAEKNDGPDGL
jgi:poly-D-alanine transfer protein DltD